MVMHDVNGFFDAVNVINLSGVIQQTVPQSSVHLHSVPVPSHKVPVREEESILKWNEISKIIKYCT